MYAHVAMHRNKTEKTDQWLSVWMGGGQLELQAGLFMYTSPFFPRPTPPPVVMLALPLWIEYAYVYFKSSPSNSDVCPSLSHPLPDL